MEDDRDIANALGDIAQSFNGATAMKPWKRDTEPSDGPDCGPSFNGATAMKPWKRPAEHVDQSEHGCGFNGATAMRPWKRMASTATTLRTDRRLQWGHGDEAVEERCVRSTCRNAWTCFNGATAMKPWKTIATPSRLVAAGHASMGPRR